MSTLYKRNDSPYWWYSAKHKGRRLRQSTNMSQKQLAKKVQTRYDGFLADNDLSFLNGNREINRISDYIFHYLGFISSIKSTKSVVTAKGALRIFQVFLDKIKIVALNDITVRVLNDFIDQECCAPKTIRNHMIEISLLLKQAMVEGLIKSNPAQNVTLPKMMKSNLHRNLDREDIKVIFQNAGCWVLFLKTLYYTGLRAGDVAMLTYGNIDKKRGLIRSLVRKSRKIHEFPLNKDLVKAIPNDPDPAKPIFPELFSENDGTRNGNLARVRKHMQDVLKAYNRPKATLHSFRTTFNNTLRDLGLSIEDRAKLLANASSETTKIYTHPNLELGREWIDKLPTIAT